MPALPPGVLRWLLLMPMVLTPPYVISNHLTLFTAREVPRVALIDEGIPYLPELGWVYLGLFPFMWWAVVSQPSSAHARRYVLGAACCAYGVSVLCVVFPTSFPRPPETPGIHAAIATVDTERNACPSLHGTYVAYSVAWLMAVFRSWAWRMLIVGMGLAILVATIAVRQHGIIDLAFGIAIGLGAYWWARIPRTVA